MDERAEWRILQINNNENYFVKYILLLSFSFNNFLLENENGNMQTDCKLYKFSVYPFVHCGINDIMYASQCHFTALKPLKH